MTTHPHSLENAELLEQYQEAGFAGSVGWGERVAVLVIDMAGAWTRPDLRIGSDLREVTESIQEVLRAARARDDVPVIFTTMAYDATYSDVSEVTLLKTPHSREMIRGSERTRLIPEMGRLPHEALIEKPRASAFFNTNLLSVLIGERIDTVVIVGCSTSGCIRSTCESALDYGFRAIVPREAVGDRSWSAHEGALFDINARFADVVPLAEVVERLEAVAAPPAGRR